VFIREGLNGHADLPEVTQACGTVAHLAKAFEIQAKQGSQDRNDGDHGEKFDNRETALW